VPLFRTPIDQLLCRNASVHSKLPDPSGLIFTKPGRLRYATIGLI